MKLFQLVLLYTALALGANTALAGISDVAALRSGTMKKLVVHASAKPVGTTLLGTMDGAQTSLSDFRGKYLLVNFWATWCAPCLKEMPQLDALQQEFGGEDFQVLTIATGRNQPAAIKRFFKKAAIKALPVLTDPKQALAREMDVLALPVTLVLDREGREVARMVGDAEWYGDSGRAIIAALIADPAG
jgi:thiol-disulfide isomerase/thioredoxin